MVVGKLSDQTDSVKSCYIFVYPDHIPIKCFIFMDNSGMLLTETNEDDVALHFFLFALCGVQSTFVHF